MPKRKKDATQTVAEAAAAGLIPTRPQTPGTIATLIEPDDELWGVDTVCAFFGGDKPLNKVTLYRAISDGRIPRPINVSASLVRWLASECRAARAKSIERRDAGARTAPRGGGRKSKTEVDA